MIKDHKTVDLYGKKIFEKVVVSDTVKNHNPMDHEACFLYVLEGINYSYSEDDFIVLNTKESVLMKCGNYFYKGTPDKSTQRLRFIAVHLYPDVMRKVYERNIPQFLLGTSVNKSDMNMITIQPNILMAKFMESLRLYMDTPEIMNEEMTELKFREFILLLLQTDKYGEVKTLMENLFNPGVISFKETIKAHLFSDLTIKDLATLTHLSLATFKREFKKQFNDTPASYIKEQRLNRAAELLMVSNKRVNDIAYDCQFNDPAHFSTVFKEKFKQSPSDYRMSFSKK